MDRVAYSLKQNHLTKFKCHSKVSKSFDLPTPFLSWRISAFISGAVLLSVRHGRRAVVVKSVFLGALGGSKMTALQFHCSFRPDLPCISKTIKLEHASSDFL
jgi:hypothetical protein